MQFQYKHQLLAFCLAALLLASSGCSKQEPAATANPPTVSTFRNIAADDNVSPDKALKDYATLCRLVGVLEQEKQEQQNLVTEAEKKIDALTSEAFALVDTFEDASKQFALGVDAAANFAIVKKARDRMDEAGKTLMAAQEDINTKQKALIEKSVAWDKAFNLRYVAYTRFENAVAHTHKLNKFSAALPKAMRAQEHTYIMSLKQAATSIPSEELDAAYARYEECYIAVEKAASERFAAMEAAPSEKELKDKRHKFDTLLRQLANNSSPVDYQIAREAGKEYFKLQEGAASQAGALRILINAHEQAQHNYEQARQKVLFLSL